MAIKLLIKLDQSLLPEEQEDILVFTDNLE